MNINANPQPQLIQTDDRYFLLKPTQLTCTDLTGNPLWHDAINTTTQYLLTMQLSERYLVLLTRRDLGWGNVARQVSRCHCRQRLHLRF